MPKRSVKKRQFFFPKLSLILFLIGVLCLSVYSGFRVHQSMVLSFNVSDYQPVTQIQTYEAPVRVQIPAQNIDVPVIESYVRDNQWEINPDGASHLAGSANPGQRGNVVVYGHNLDRIFGRIRSLKKGDVINLSTKSGQNFSYRVEETLVVTPKDVKVIEPTLTEMLTLYTCTGFFDSQRFVVKATPV